jgi:hypothetical protein
MTTYPQKITFGDRQYDPPERDTAESSIRLA